MANDVDHLFMLIYHLCILISEVPLYVLCILDYLFFYCVVLRVFYILNIKLSQIYDLQIPLRLEFAFSSFKQGLL